MKIGDRFFILDFNYYCKHNNIRCLRNNIYKSVKVKNYEHLVHLWRTHPTVDNSKSEEDNLIKSLRYVIRHIKEYKPNKLICTYESFFWLTFDLSEEEMIKMLLKINSNLASAKHKIL